MTIRQRASFGAAMSHAAESEPGSAAGMGMTLRRRELGQARTLVRRAPSLRGPMTKTVVVASECGQRRAQTVIEVAAAACIERTAAIRERAPEAGHSSGVHPAWRLQPERDRVDRALGFHDVATVDRHGRSRRWATLMRSGDSAAERPREQLTLAVGLQVHSSKPEGAPGRSDDSDRQLPVEAIREQMRQKSGSYRATAEVHTAGAHLDGSVQESWVVGHKDPLQNVVLTRRYIR